MMPGKPLEVSQTVESEIGKIPTYSFVAQTGTLVYAVTYADYPIALDTSVVVKTGLDNSRDLFLSGRKGKLISEAEISLGKYAGRELRAKIDVGAARSRTYIIHQRLYMLLAITLDEDRSKRLESKEVSDFLGSFKLLREPQPVASTAPSMSRVESEIDKLELPPDFNNRPVSWREVPSPEFGFTIWMPSEPFRKKVPLNPNDRRLDINLWMARSASSVYQVMVQPMLAAPGSEEHRKILYRSLLDGILGSGEVKLESEKPVSFEGHSGREYKLRVISGVGTGRAYIIGNNAYFLLALPVKKPVKSNDDSADVARFFDSFRLTKDPDAAPTIGAVSAGPSSWREFSEPGHGFKVLLPGEPKKESSYTRGISTYTLLSGGAGVSCMIIRERFPVEPESMAAPGGFYKYYINDFAKSAGLEATGETNVVVDGRQAREYKLKKGALTGVVRVVLDGRDVYSITALRILPEVDPKSISTFLGSFKLIEKSPKDEFAEPPPPPPPAPAPVGKDTITVSGGVLQASGIKKVEPVYPPIARAAKTEGVVRVQVTVSEEGKVIEAQVIEGPPLLRDAALQAARQWEFRPTELSGKPVKITGVLTFQFSLK